MCGWVTLSIIIPTTSHRYITKPSLKMATSWTFWFKDGTQCHTPLGPTNKVCANTGVRIYPVPSVGLLLNGDPAVSPKLVFRGAVHSLQISTGETAYADKQSLLRALHKKMLPYRAVTKEWKTYQGLKKAGDPRAIYDHMMDVRSRVPLPTKKNNKRKAAPTPTPSGAPKKRKATPSGASNSTNVRFPYGWSPGNFFQMEDDWYRFVSLTTVEVVAKKVKSCNGRKTVLYANEKVITGARISGIRVERLEFRDNGWVAFTRGLESQLLYGNRPSPDSFHFNGTKYDVAWSADCMTATQTNTQTGYTRDIRVINLWEEYRASQARAHSKGNDFPNGLLRPIKPDRMDPQARMAYDAYYAKEKNPQVYAVPSVLVRASERRVKVTLAELKRKNHNARQEWVWHGTQFKNIEPIISGGFQYAGAPNGARYGPGIYFSTGAGTVSRNFSEPSADNRAGVILCKCVSGKQQTTSHNTYFLNDDCRSGGDRLRHILCKPYGYVNDDVTPRYVIVYDK